MKQVYDRKEKKTQTVVYKLEANCAYKGKTWKPKTRQWYPGNCYETDVILIETIRDVKKGEQLWVDYGDQTAGKMFGVKTILKATSKDHNQKRRHRAPVRKQECQSQDSESDGDIQDQSPRVSLNLRSKARKIA